MQWKSTLHKIKSFIKMVKGSQKHFLTLILIGGCARAMVPFLGFFFSAQIINCFINKNYDMAMWNIFSMLVSELFVGILGKITSAKVEVIRDSVDEQIKQRLSAKAYELQYDHFERQSTLEELRKTELAMRGMGGIGSQIDNLSVMVENLFGILYSIGFTCMLFLEIQANTANLWDALGSILILIAAYCLAIWVYMKNNEKTSIAFNEMNERNNYVNGLWGYVYGFISNQRHAKDIRVFQMQDTFVKKMETLNKQALGFYVQVGGKTARYFAQSAFVGQLLSGIAYIIIGLKAIQGLIPVGNVLLYVGAMNQIGSQFLSFAMLSSNFMARAEVLDTYAQFLSRPSMSYDGTLPIEKRDDGEYLFEFHDVSFHYPGTSQEILSQVNLQFRVKEKMAIVGRNGAGKTTLIKLLCRLYEPTKGFITLNGIDIRKYSYQEYVQAFSVVFQDFSLFSMTLGGNLAGKDSYDVKKAWDVLERVQMKEKIAALEDGLHTRLYNNNGKGVDVSGGEAQKIAIARALYKDAPFVILDEPTAALDPFAESQIYENFNQMIENKTAIYISHRMSSCKFCDRIVVFDSGRVCEEGTHETLLKKNGIYAGLYETQAQYYA